MELGLILDWEERASTTLFTNLHTGLKISLKCRQHDEFWWCRGWFPSIYCPAVIWSELVWGAIRAMQLLGEEDRGGFSREVGRCQNLGLSPSLLESSRLLAMVYFWKRSHIMRIRIGYICVTQDTKRYDDIWQTRDCLCQNVKIWSLLLKEKLTLELAVQPSNYDLLFTS